MKRPCEVCSGLAIEGQEPKSRRMKRVLVGARIVALCDEHAGKALDLGIETVDELRAAFGETRGHRSLVDRRSPLDRRLFPARPEGRRKSYGRRSTDP